MAAWYQMRQLSLGRFDLELHVNYTKYENSNDLEGDLQKILIKYTPTYTTTPPLIINSFDHIFSGGYAAAYYSYKWAEVLEADVFG